jgi:dihydrofolate reductase
MSEAKRAAGDKNVLVHGAGIAQLALAAGVLGELEIHLISVLLGQGRRLFDNLRPEHIELERTRILEGGRCHPHALPRPALNAAFPRLLFQGKRYCGRRQVWASSAPLN